MSRNQADFLIPEHAAEEWRQLAGALKAVSGPVPCTQELDLWFAPRSSPLRDEAVAGCGRCPVLHLCAAYGMASGEYAGVWGATTDEQRRQAVRLEAAS